MRYCAWRYPAYRAQLAERDFVGQVRLGDADAGRWFEIKAGRVRSGAGLHPKADVTLCYETAATAVRPARKAAALNPIEALRYE